MIPTLDARSLLHRVRALVATPARRQALGVVALALLVLGGGWRAHRAARRAVDAAYAEGMATGRATERHAAYLQRRAQHVARARALAARAAAQDAALARARAARAPLAARVTVVDGATVRIDGAALAVPASLRPLADAYAATLPVLAADSGLVVALRAEKDAALARAADAEAEADTSAADAARARRDADQRVQAASAEGRRRGRVEGSTVTAAVLLLVLLLGG